MFFNYCIVSRSPAEPGRYVFFIYFLYIQYLWVAMDKPWEFSSQKDWKSCFMQCSSWLSYYMQGQFLCSNLGLNAFPKSTVVTGHSLPALSFTHFITPPWNISEHHSKDDSQCLSFLIRHSDRKTFSSHKYLERMTHLHLQNPTCAFHVLR